MKHQPSTKLLNHSNSIRLFHKSPLVPFKQQCGGILSFFSLDTKPFYSLQWWPLRFGSTSQMPKRLLLNLFPLYSSSRIPSLAWLVCSPLPWPQIFNWLLFEILLKKGLKKYFAANDGTRKALKCSSWVNYINSLPEQCVFPINSSSCTKMKMKNRIVLQSLGN